MNNEIKTTNSNIYTEKPLPNFAKTAPVTSVKVNTYTYNPLAIEIFGDLITANEAKNNQLKNTLNELSKFDHYIDVTENASFVNSIQEFEDQLILNTEFKSLAEFNDYIKDLVDVAGFGTREGVVTAALALSSLYSGLTGHKLWYASYTDSTDYEMDGIQSDMKLDCRAFVWWSLYNGGFHFPQDDSGNVLNHSFAFYDYVQSKGLVRNDYSKGEIGDFIIRTQDTSVSHLMLVVGKYDGGYYVAHEYGSDHGLVISKRSYDELQYNNFGIVDMSTYYDDPLNKRKR